MKGKDVVVGSQPPSRGPGAAVRISRCSPTVFNAVMSGVQLGPSAALLPVGLMWEITLIFFLVHSGCPEGWAEREWSKGVQI